MQNRRLWFLVHGWLSLPVWLLFCFICLTGSISVLSHEITWLANPDARADNPHGLPARPLPELVAAVEEAVPGANVGHVMVYEPYLVTAISFSASGIPNALAYVNAYTGEVQAINDGFSFIEFMRSLHGWLLFPWQAGYSVGYYLVSLMSIVALGAMVTGVVIYKRFWRSFTRPGIRLNRGARALLGDLHRLVGVWSLWFLLIMGLTGGWYFAQAVLWHTATDIWTHPDPVALDELPLTDGTPPERLPLAEAMATARQTMPSLKPSLVSLPEHSRDYYSIAGSGDAWLFDQYSYRVLVNPWTGEVAQAREPAVMNPLQVITHLADPLHFGTWGGLWTKAIWFVFGLLLTGMSITGFMIWVSRTARAVRETRQSPAGEYAADNRLAVEDARS
ncbi:MAG: PepSY-associated TM helix domain-containing protein [Aquisalimonadaceae bacterium]